MLQVVFSFLVTLFLFSGCGDNKNQAITSIDKTLLVGKWQLQKADSEIRGGRVASTTEFIELNETHLIIGKNTIPYSISGNRILQHGLNDQVIEVASLNQAQLVIRQNGVRATYRRISSLTTPSSNPQPKQPSLSSATTGNVPPTGTGKGSSSGSQIDLSFLGIDSKAMNFRNEISPTVRDFILSANKGNGKIQVNSTIDFLSLTSFPIEDTSNRDYGYLFQQGKNISATAVKRELGGLCLIGILNSSRHSSILQKNASFTSNEGFQFSYSAAYYHGPARHPQTGQYVQAVGFYTHIVIRNNNDANMILGCVNLTHVPTIEDFRTHFGDYFTFSTNN